MRICYLFNSSVPSRNPSSLQVIKTCEGLIQLKHKVYLITPNTGLKYNIKNYYDLIFSPIRIKLKFFEKPIFDKKYYDLLADKFRSPHIWEWDNENGWSLRYKIFEIEENNKQEDSAGSWQGNKAR